MKLSIVISVRNRAKLFHYAIESYKLQDFKDFELVVIDDGSIEPVENLLIDLPFPVQYMRVDLTKHPLFKGYHTCCAALNIGFRKARGEVVVKTDPEVVLTHKCLSLLYGAAMRGYKAFGDVYHVGTIPKGTCLDGSALQLMKLFPKPETFALSNQYWYLLAVKKSFIEAIRGADEEYMQGVYAEDDNFAYRLGMVGATYARVKEAIAVHLDHSYEQETEPRQKRSDPDFWESGAKRNRARWAAFQRNPNLQANGTNWGDFKYIIREICK